MADIVGQHARGLVAFQPFYVNGPPHGGRVGDVHDAARFPALVMFGNRTRYPVEALAGTIAGRAG